MKWSALALSMLSVAPACSGSPERTSDTLVTDDAGRDAGGGANGADGDAAAPVPALGCDKMDILFVIDNSGSMQQEQANLAQNFPKFIEVLNAFNDGALDYRVGVTTTSFPTEILGITLTSGEEGALLKSDGMTRPWLERTDPKVTETFTSLATVGVMGSGQEQQLRAAQAAVTARVEDGANASFLREDALLALVFLTDEDDGSFGDSMGSGFPGLPGSETPIADFIASFDETKGNRKRWATAVIAGDTAPMCTSQFGDATYATRLLDFVSQTGPNAVFSSICAGDLSGSLEDALDTFGLACDNFIII